MAELKGLNEITWNSHTQGKQARADDIRKDTAQEMITSRENSTQDEHATIGCNFLTLVIKTNGKIT